MLSISAVKCTWTMFSSISRVNSASTAGQTWA